MLDGKGKGWELAKYKRTKLTSSHVERINTLCGKPLYLNKINLFYISMLDEIFNNFWCQKVFFRKKEPTRLSGSLLNKIRIILPMGLNYCVVTVPSVQVIVSPDANEPGGQSTLAQSETVPW